MSPRSPRPHLSRATTGPSLLTIDATRSLGSASYDHRRQAGAILAKYSPVTSPAARRAETTGATMRASGEKSDYFSGKHHASTPLPEQKRAATEQTEPRAGPASSYFSFPEFERHYDQRSRSEDRSQTKQRTT